MYLIKPKGRQNQRSTKPKVDKTKGRQNQRLNPRERQGQVWMCQRPCLGDQGALGSPGSSQKAHLCLCHQRHLSRHSQQIYIAPCGKHDQMTLDSCHHRERRQNQLWQVPWRWLHQKFQSLTYWHPTRM